MATLILGAAGAAIGGSIGGNLIWATDFREETETSRQRAGGGKGGGGGGAFETTEYRCFVSFAVALCEGGPAGRGITGVGRIWADGDPMDLSGVTWRWHAGDAAQEPDPLILAIMGTEETPAYRGTVYVVWRRRVAFGFLYPGVSP
jgi:hypothetical protein